MRHSIEDKTHYFDVYTEHNGQRHRVKIEIRVSDMATYLASRAVRNRTHRARMAFAKAKVDFTFKPE